jgi:hypothetical protein
LASDHLSFDEYRFDVVFYTSDLRVELKATASIIGQNARKGITTFANANNHYEGSAPLTIQRLLRLL